MQLNQMPKTTAKSQKRAGRGYGSGRGGHTVGRGQKGQKSRSKLPLYFEGTAMRKSLIRRLPMMPGKGKNSGHQTKPVIVNLKYLNLLKSGAVVDLETLAHAKIVDLKTAKRQGVKILGDGELKVALTVQLPTSKSAAEKITQAGGKVEKVPAGASSAASSGAPTRQKKSTGKKTVKPVKKTTPVKTKAIRQPAKPSKKPKSTKKTK